MCGVWCMHDVFVHIIQQLHVPCVLRCCCYLVLLLMVIPKKKKRFYSQHSETNSHRCGPKYVCSIVCAVVVVACILFSCSDLTLLYLCTTRLFRLYLYPLKFTTHTHTQSTLFAHVSIERQRIKKNWCGTKLVISGVRLLLGKCCVQPARKKKEYNFCTCTYCIYTCRIVRLAYTNSFYVQNYMESWNTLFRICVHKALIRVTIYSMDGYVLCAYGVHTLP